MNTPLLAEPYADQLALLIVLVLVVWALIRVTGVAQYDNTIIAICFGSPLAIGLYYLLSRLFRAFATLAGW
jgi:hypothetical protein